MTPERWREIERIFHAATARPRSAWASFLLASPATANGVLTSPALALADPLASDGSTSVLSGRQLGTYLVQERIGAGGMGDVYRARDTKLGRDVAIKILPRAFTSEPDRLARFRREARVLATLNHPNIATIHGIEEGPLAGPAALDGARAEEVNVHMGSSWSSSRGRPWPSGLRAAACVRRTRWRLRGSSPTRSTLRTKRASSTAI